MGAPTWPAPTFVAPRVNRRAPRSRAQKYGGPDMARPNVRRAPSESGRSSVSRSEAWGPRHGPPQRSARPGGARKGRAGNREPVESAVVATAVGLGEVRAPEEAGDEACARPRVERARLIDLLDASGVHLGDAVGGPHGLRLIVVT